MLGISAAFVERVVIVKNLLLRVSLGVAPRIAIRVLEMPGVDLEFGGDPDQTPQK